MTDALAEGMGGISTAVASLSRTLQQRGHQVCIFAAEDPTRRLADVHVVNLRALHYRRFPGGRIPISPFHLAQELHRFQPDVIHNHSCSALGIQTLAVAQMIGVPALCTCHVLLTTMLDYAPFSLGRLPLAGQAATQLIMTFLNRFPVVTAPSWTLCHQLRTMGLTVPNLAVSNGIELDMFPCSDSLNSGASTLLHVGRLGSEKRVDVLLRGFAMAARRKPDLRLWIAGDGPQDAALRNLTQVLGVESSVRFLGRIARESLPDLYRRSSLFLTTSPMETQGLVVLEAMASGLPVLAVNAMALPELVRSDYNGLLVPAEDAEALAHAILFMVGEPSQLRRMGQHARHTAERHDIQRTVRRYEHLYQSLVQRHSSIGLNPQWVNRFSRSVETMGTH
jgi:1,2-diacylglycerol 3-alpha-glucosyltransferase